MTDDASIWYYGEDSNTVKVRVMCHDCDTELKQGGLEVSNNILWCEDCLTRYRINGIDLEELSEAEYEREKQYTRDFYRQAVNDCPDFESPEELAEYIDQIEE